MEADSVRALSFNRSCTLAFHNTIAGATPNTSAVSTVAATVNASTRPPIDVSVRRGTALGIIPMVTAIAARANSRPAAPPAAARIRLSTRNCRNCEPERRMSRCGCGGFREPCRPRRIRTKHLRRA